MKPFPLLTLSLGSLIFITGCDDGGSLRQQLSRSEADLQDQRDELRKARTEITELKEKLNSKSPPPAPAAAPVASSPSKTSEPAVVSREQVDPAALPSEYISAVKELESKLKKKAGSIGVTSYPRTIFAGFTATVEGKKRGVAIPFFSEQDGTTWVSSYTDDQILAELQPTPQPSRVQPPSTTQQVTQTQPSTSGSVATQPQPQTPRPAQPALQVTERPSPPQPAAVVNSGSSAGSPLPVVKLVPPGSGSQGDSSSGGTGGAAAAITNGTPMGAGGDEVRPTVKEVGGKAVLSFPKQ